MLILKDKSGKPIGTHDDSDDFLQKEWLFIVCACTVVGSSNTIPTGEND